MSKSRRSASFSLIELLTVMAVIFILVGLVLMAGSGALTKARRSRAAVEIQALAAALDGYKVDNGSYPITNIAIHYGMSGTLLTNTSTAVYFATTLDGTSSAYIQNSETLYLALSGQTNFSDTPIPGTKAYLPFTIRQVANPTSGSYVRDPWGYSYGYSTGSAAGATTPSYPFNGSGFYDLWSTGGNTASAVVNNNLLTNAWISNWQ